MRIPDLGRTGQGWVVLQFAFFAAIAAAGLLGPAWGSLAGPSMEVAGAVFITAGGWLVVAGWRALGSSFSPFPRPVPDGRLVRHGIYESVRHPIYGGVLLVGFGWSLVTASPVALALSVALVVLFVLKSLREEAWLAEHYAGYEEYRRRTRRFYPPLFRTRPRP
jgi:protein-S-isoprenylcysteine O-methyltransferase Ste14